LALVTDPKYHQTTSRDDSLLAHHQGRSFLMNPEVMNVTAIATPLATEPFSIQELEQRFELLAAPAPSGEMMHPDWSCSFTFRSK
jgi:hypothetical protein